MLWKAQHTLSKRSMLLLVVILFVLQLFVIRAYSFKYVRCGQRHLSTLKFCFLPTNVVSKVFTLSVIIDIYILLGKPLALTECVKVIVLGFTSPDDQLKDEHFCYDQEDPRLNFFTYDGNEEDMYDYILQHFSHDGNTVLDMTGELEGILVTLHGLKQENHRY